MKEDEEIRRERRRHIRIKRNFIISFYDKHEPSLKHEVSQIKNISLGGACIITSRYYRPATKIGVELKTPYLTGTVHFDGTVLDSHEKVANLLYETRLVFENLKPQAEFVLNKIVEYFKEGKKIIT